MCSSDLNYVGEATTEPLINDLYQKFGVKTNILGGNIEFITGTPVGNLIVSLSGDRQNLGKVGDYLAEKNISVELLGGKDGIF